jgi:hypothetical protein
MTSNLTWNPNYLLGDLVETVSSLYVKDLKTGTFVTVEANTICMIVEIEGVNNIQRIPPIITVVAQKNCSSPFVFKTTKMALSKIFNGESTF